MIIYDYKEKERTNSHNCHHKKVLKTDISNVEIHVPQDTECKLEAKIVEKHTREVSPTILDAILSMYMKTKQITLLLKLNRRLFFQNILTPVF